MMFKEKGYDAFLAEKIRRAEQDIAQGRVVSTEQSRLEARQAIQQKMKELEAFKQRELSYA